MKLFGKTVACLKADDLLGSATAWTFLKQKQPANTEEEIFETMSEMLEEISKKAETTLQRLDGGKWQLEGDWESVKNAHCLLAFNTAMVRQGKIANCCLYEPGCRTIEVQTDPEQSEGLNIKREKADVDGTLSQPELAPQCPSSFERVMVWVNQNVIAQGAAEELLKVISNALGTSLHSDETQTQWCLDGSWENLLSAYRTMQYLVVCLSLGQTVSQLVIPQMISSGYQTEPIENIQMQIMLNGMCNNLNTNQESSSLTPKSGMTSKSESTQGTSSVAINSCQTTTKVNAQQTSMSQVSNKQSVYMVANSKVTQQQTSQQLVRGSVPSNHPMYNLSGTNTTSSNAMQLVQSGAATTSAQTGMGQNGGVSAILPAGSLGMQPNQSGIPNGATGTRNAWCLPLANNPGYMVVYNPQIGLVLSPMVQSLPNLQGNTTSSQGQIATTQGQNVGLTAVQNQQVCVQNADSTVATNITELSNGRFQTLGSIVSELTHTTPVKQEADQSSDVAKSPGMDVSSTVSQASHTNKPSPKREIKKEIGTASSQRGPTRGPFQIVCKLCGFLSRTKRGLAEHRRRRHLQRPFKCETCLKCFSEEMFLRKHVASSSCRGSVIGESKLVCKICTFVSQTERGLSEHIRRRHLERPFKCELCTAAFSDQFYLRKHRIEIHNLDLHSCDLCGAETKTLRSLAEHKSKIHNIRQPKSKKSSHKAAPSKQRTSEGNTPTSNVTSQNPVVANWPQLLASAGITTGVVLSDGVTIAQTSGNQTVQAVAQGSQSGGMTDAQQAVFPTMMPVRMTTPSVTSNSNQVFGLQ